MARLARITFFGTTIFRLRTRNSLSLNCKCNREQQELIPLEFNPIKNSQDHDADGIFIKKWVPELAEIPAELIHEPLKLNAIEQQFYNCEIGKDYPFPIVDIEETRKKASDIVRSFRKKDDVKEEGKRILKKHVTNFNKPKNARSKKTKPTQ